jgi:hypothetical protein
MSMGAIYTVYSQFRSAYLAIAKKADLGILYINHSQIHECGNWETEHYHFVLEITRPRRSFLGIYKSEPDIYIRFSPAAALHLQRSLSYF